MQSNNKDLKTLASTNKTVREKVDAPPSRHNLTPQEAKQLIDYVMQDSPDMYGPLSLSGLLTGMRLSELCALHWSDIDWENGRIHIQRAVKGGDPGVANHWQDRYVEMSTLLQEALTDLLIRRQAEAEGYGHDFCEIVFHSRGDYRKPDTVQKAFRRHLTRAGLSEFRFHDLRKTYARQLLTNGASPEHVSGQLGHYSTRMTLLAYGPAKADGRHDALDSLDALISKDPE